MYNEDIRDLLVAGGSTEKLEVRQSDLGNHVPGLTVMAVQDLQVRAVLIGFSPHTVALMGVMLST